MEDDYSKSETSDLDRIWDDGGTPATRKRAPKKDPQQKLFDTAAKDGLTGLYNKTCLLDRIGTDVAYAIRHQTPLTLMILNIDRFKKINESFGARACEHVLKVFADVLRHATRTEDVLARYGDDEFAILMRDVNDETALMLAERLRTIVEQTAFEFDGKALSITVGIGIGTMGEEPDPLVQSADDLVKRAELYLHQAKCEGRNHVAGKAAA